MLCRCVSCRICKAGRLRNSGPCALAPTTHSYVECSLSRFANVDRPLRILDLGAGNGWLIWRASLAGHAAIGMDIRDDDVDGLRAGNLYLEDGNGFERIAGSSKRCRSATLLSISSFTMHRFTTRSISCHLERSATCRSTRRPYRHPGFAIL
jgi:hypothetical protein